MKTLARRAPSTIRFLLVAVVIAANAAVVTSDRDQAFASHTQVFYTITTTSPVVVTNVITMVGAPPRTLHVWAKDVDDLQGLGNFEVLVRYNPAYMQIGSITEHTAWLDDTGRTPNCVGPVIEPVPDDPVLWQARVSCFTMANPPPYGPLGSGKLAEFEVLPGTSLGVTQLTNLTVMTDAGELIPPNTVIEPQMIPSANLSALVRTARCGDLNDDGWISGLDFFQMLSKFGTTGFFPNWHEQKDLDGNGAITGTDLFILLGAFGSSC